MRFGGGSGAATHRISIGSLRFLAEDEQCTNVTDRARTIVGGLTRGGGTGPQQQIVVVCVAVDRRFVATIHLSDTIKSDARATVAYLRYVIGAEVWMVTGDAMQSALAVANDVGIDPACIEAHMMPEQKVDVVKRLQQDGTRVVAFVGDGINDAAALSQANVGIAIGAGTDVAIDAADAVLVQEALFNVCTLLDLTRAVIRRIYFNFAWACMYNIVMLPISSGCFFFLLRKQLPPVVAGAAMMMSSLSVVCSSLLLRCYRPPSQDDALATLRGRRRAIGSNPRLGNELVGLLNPDA